jgi:hypothetical protein
MDPSVAGSDEGVTMESSTPRPHLDVSNLDSPRTLVKKRKRLVKKIVKKCMDLSKYEKKATTKILSRYRRKQRKNSGETESDPDPYTPDYVFYCLEVARED